MWFYVFLFILGICGGFYTVPLNAFFQQYSPEEYRGMYLSVLGYCDSCGVFSGWWIFVVDRRTAGRYLR